MAASATADLRASALLVSRLNGQRLVAPKLGRIIQAHATALHIEKLLDRDELTRLYEDPFQNSRVPDFIAITDHGVICTGGTKLAGHGGFSNDDRNVALVVSSPRIKQAKIVEDLTFTTQIAPTILDALDLDPRSLQAVREEGVQVLK